MTQGELHLCEYENGMSGSFMTSLFRAIDCADINNMALLGMGFPEEVEACHRFTSEREYWQNLNAEFHKRV